MSHHDASSPVPCENRQHSHIADKNGGPPVSHADDSNRLSEIGHRMPDNLRGFGMANVSNVLNTDNNSIPLGSNPENYDITNDTGVPRSSTAESSSIVGVLNVLHIDENKALRDSDTEYSIMADGNELPDTREIEDSSIAQNSNVLNTDENGIPLNSNAEDSSAVGENDIPDTSHFEGSFIADVSNVLNTGESGIPRDSNAVVSSDADENNVPNTSHCEDSSTVQNSNVLNSDDNGAPCDSHAEKSSVLDAKTEQHDSNVKDSCTCIPQVNEKNGQCDLRAEGASVPSKSSEVTVDHATPNEDSALIRIPPAVEERLIHQLLFWRVKWELEQTQKPLKPKERLAGPGSAKTTRIGDSAEASGVASAAATASANGAQNELIAAQNEKTNACALLNGKAENAPTTLKTDDSGVTPTGGSGATAEGKKAHQYTPADAGYVTSEIIRKAPSAAAVKELLEANCKLLLREVVAGQRRVRQIRALERKVASLPQRAAQKNGTKGTEAKNGEVAQHADGTLKDTPEEADEISGSSDDESRKEEDRSTDEEHDGEDGTNEDEGNEEAMTVTFADVLFYRVVLHLGSAHTLASRCCAEILKKHSSQEIEELLGNPVLFMNKMKLILRSLGKVVDAPKDVSKKVPTGAHQTSKHAASQPMPKQGKPKKEFQADVISGANVRIFLALHALEQTRIVKQDGHAEASNTVGRALLEMATAHPPLPLAQFTFIIKIACRDIVQPDDTTALAIAAARKQLEKLKELKSQHDVAGNSQQGDGAKSGPMANTKGDADLDITQAKEKGGKKGKGERGTTAIHGGGGVSNAEVDSRWLREEETVFQSLTPIKNGKNVSTQVNPDDFADPGVRIPPSTNAIRQPLMNAANNGLNLTATSLWPKITILQRAKNDADPGKVAIAQSKNSPPLGPRNPHAATWESFVASKSASTNTTTSAVTPQRSPANASQDVLLTEWPKVRPQQRANAPNVPLTDANAWPTLGTNGSPKKSNGASSPAQRWSDRVRKGRLWADELVDEEVECVQRDAVLGAVPRAVKRMEGALKSSSSTAAPTGLARQKIPQAGIRMVVIVEAPGDSITFKPDATFVARRDALARICASALYLHQKTYNPVCAEMIAIFEDGNCLRFGADFVKSCPVPSERSIVEAMKSKSRRKEQKFASFNDICRQYKTENTYGLLLCSTHPDAIVDFSEPHKVHGPLPTQYTLLVLLGTVKDVERTMVDQFQRALRNEEIPLVKASLGNVTEFTSKIIDVLHGYIGYNHLIPRVLAIAKLGEKAGKRRPVKQKFKPPPLRAVLGSLGLQGAAASYHVVRAMVGQLWRSRGAYEENSITFVGDEVLTVHGTVVQNLNSQHKAAPCERNVLGFLKQLKSGKQGEFRVDPGVVDDEMPRGTMVVEVELGNTGLPLLDCTSCAPAKADGAIIVVLHTKNARAPYAFNALPEGILICRVHLPHMSHHAALALLNLYNQNNVLWPSLVRHAKRKLEVE